MTKFAITVLDEYAPTEERATTLFEYEADNIYFAIADVVNSMKRDNVPWTTFNISVLSEAVTPEKLDG